MILPAPSRLFGAAARVAAALAALALAATALSAQQRDTVPRPARDTIQVVVPPEAVRVDTLPDRPGQAAADSAANDSLVRAPTFPEFPSTGPSGFGPGVWEFTADDFQRFHGLSVLEFLDRVPGILITRSGNFGRPAGVSPYGAGGGRFRVFLDGWEMRPLNGAVPDLQRIPLVDVVAMRVERGLGEVRVHLHTFRLADGRAFAQIDGADGDFDTRILRAFFARPIGKGFAIQVGLDVTESSGFRRFDPFSFNTPIARLTYEVRPDLALQLDYRRTAIDTEQRGAGNAAAIWNESLDRGEVMLRGRGRFLGRLWLDAAVGRSTEAPAGNDTTSVDVTSFGGYARAAMEIPLGSLSAAVRVHGGEERSFAPASREVSARASLTPLPWLNAGGEARVLSLGGAGGTELEGWVRAGPFRGLSAFGQFAAGARGIPFLADTVVTLETFGGLGGGTPLTQQDSVTVFRTIEPTLSAIRAGAEFTRGSYAVGAALVTQDVAALAPYGLSFDRETGIAPGNTLSGVESYASVPVFSPNLRFDGWFLYRLDDTSRRYTPTYFGRGALEFRNTYRTGNLEPTFRIEALGRARSPVPSATGDSTTLDAPRYTILNLFVQIRIIDVRIFYRLDNAFNVTTSEVDGTRRGGARAIYGLRWFFRN